MSASLLVLIPVALLFTVSLLCFVGCILDPTGHNLPYYEYSEGTVKPEGGLVAFWPLADSPVPTGGLKAIDIEGGHDGDYVTAAEYPPIPNASAKAPGTFELGQPGLLPGDTEPGDNTKRKPCVLFDGGYVRVPFAAEINPPAAGGFTIEAWVRATWTADDPDGARMVFDGRTISEAGIIKGIALYANIANRWEVLVGRGTDKFDLATDDTDIVIGPEGSLYHVVATFDGADLRLFVNGVQKALTAQATYVHNDIGRLFIGTGGPWRTERTPQDDPNDLTLGPITPFKGFLQCVAVYNTALTPEKIALHNNRGRGIGPPRSP